MPAQGKIGNFLPPFCLSDFSTAKRDCDLSFLEPLLQLTTSGLRRSPSPELLLLPENRERRSGGGDPKRREVEAGIGSTVGISEFFRV